MEIKTAYKTVLQLSLWKIKLLWNNSQTLSEKVHVRVYLKLFSQTNKKSLWNVYETVYKRLKKSYNKLVKKLTKDLQSLKAMEENMADKKTVTPEEKKLAAEKHVDGLVQKALVALEEMRKLDQDQVDYIVAKASVAALDAHGELALHAFE